MIQETLPPQDFSKQKFFEKYAFSVPDLLRDHPEYLEMYLKTRNPQSLPAYKNQRDYVLFVYDLSLRV